MNEKHMSDCEHEGMEGRCGWCCPARNRGNCHVSENEMISNHGFNFKNEDELFEYAEQMLDGPLTGWKKEVDRNTVIDEHNTAIDEFEAIFYNEKLQKCITVEYSYQLTEKIVLSFTENLRAESGGEIIYSEMTRVDFDKGE